MSPSAIDSLNANRNVRAFLLFRIFFNTRFYYPVLAVLFLDLGLSVEQYSLLNVAWAAAIVVFEVPSGALADLIGRKKLVVAAAVLMVVEMAVFAAPVANVELLFWLFLGNRILSGMAEACASGADEALVYDSLAAAGRQKEWPGVLDRLNKLSGLSFFIAMILGGACYDPSFLNFIGKKLGFMGHLVASDVVRLPIYLTLISAFVTLFAALTMHEAPLNSEKKISIAAAFRNVLWSGQWILRSPVALFVLLATLANDCVLRLVMTLTSKYFRLIELPEVAFGFIGAASGLLLSVSPIIAKKFIKLGTPRRAFAAVSVGSLVGLIGLGLVIPYWGLIFVFLIGTSMGVVGFLSSNYLNEIAEPSRRATILSFRGLSTNLAYGAIGIFFAMLLKGIDAGAAGPSNDVAFVNGLKWLPGVFVVLILSAYLSGLRRFRSVS